MACFQGCFAGLRRERDADGAAAHVSEVLPPALRILTANDIYRISVLGGTFVGLVGLVGMVGLGWLGGGCLGWFAVKLGTVGKSWWKGTLSGVLFSQWYALLSTTVVVDLRVAKGIGYPVLLRDFSLMSVCMHLFFNAHVTPHLERSCVMFLVKLVIVMILRISHCHMFFFTIFEKAMVVPGGKLGETRYPRVTSDHRGIYIPGSTALPSSINQHVLVA